MKLKLDKKNQRNYLIISLFFLTIVFAVIHNVVNLFSTNSKRTKSKLYNQTTNQLNIISETTNSIDTLYFRNLNSLFDNVKIKKSLSLLDDALKAFDDFSVKFPNSIFKSEVISKKRELFKFRKYIVTRDSVINEISKLNHLQKFNKSLILLSKSKNIFDNEELANLKNDIIEERDRPIKLSITELLANSKMYDGKIVEVDGLHPISNDIKNKYFTVYKSTGTGSLDFDTDLRIQIRYTDAINRDDLVYLTGDNHPNISVIGKFVDISFFGSYIDAKEINY